MIITYSIGINPKNKTMQKIKTIQSKIKLPELSKDIFKKLNISNLGTPTHTTFAELKRNHTNELMESTNTMIRTYFSQIEVFSNSFYKAIDDDNRTIRGHRLKVPTQLLFDTINSIKSFSFNLYNDSTQSIFDDAVYKINNEANKLIKIRDIENIHSLTPIKCEIRCELKEILSKIILIARSTKKSMDTLNKTS